MNPTNMKRLLFSAMALLIFFTSDATVVTRYLRADFGAKGNDTVNDTKAFIKACHFFKDTNNVHYPTDQGVLIIETKDTFGNPAVYKVGMQLGLGEDTTIDGQYFSNTSEIKSGLPLMDLPSYVNGFTIKSDSDGVKAKIKYCDSLWFGAFNPPNFTFKIYTIPCNSSTCYTFHGAVFNPTGTNMPSYGCDSCGTPSSSLCLCNISSTLYRNVPIVVDSFVNSSGVADTLPQWINGYENTDERTRATPGNAFVFQGSRNVTIKDIEIDGNNINFKWGTTWGDKGIQVAHRGVKFVGGENITLSNVNFHHFGLDGIEVTSGTKHVTLLNSIFNYNTRQGFSWTGGDTILATNCEFSHTGKANGYGGLPFGSSPAAGMDIEPEFPYTCKSGVFNNCYFEDNSGQAVVNDAYINHNAGDITFHGCRFWDVDGFGLYCRGERFVFDSCEIYCCVIRCNAGDSLNETTKFFNCHFEDKPYNGVHLPTNYLLVSLDGYKSTQFHDCLFKVNDEGRGICLLNCGLAGPEKYFVVDGCTFAYNNLGSEAASTLSGVRLLGKNIIKNVLNGINSYPLIRSDHIVLEGSNSSCNPTILEIEGQVEHYMTGTDTFRIGRKSDGTSGYSQYLIKDKSLSYIENAVKIEIGDSSAVHIKSGGSITGSGDIILRGQFIAHGNSYMSLPEDSVYNTSVSNPNTLWYIDRTCNANITTTSPVWCNGIGFGTGATSAINSGNWVPGLSIGSPLCVQGGHSAITSNICTTLYKNIVSGHSMSVLYNKSDTCVGAANTPFSFKVVGGIAPYRYNLDGAIVTATSYASIDTGNHTLIVTDTIGCIDTLVIHIGSPFKYTIIKGCVGIDSARFSTNACGQPLLTVPIGASYSYNSSTHTFAVSAPGTYTLSVVVGTDTIRKKLYIGQCDSCAVADIYAEWYPQDSPVTLMFSDGIAPSGPIVLSGKISVDTTLYIYNNANVYLTSGSEFDIDTNQTIVVNTSTLKGCSSYWKGITADGTNRTVIINHYSTLKDMSSGVQIRNNAFLQARESTFLNNLNQGIAFYGMNDPNYNGMIWADTFKSDTSMFSFAGTDWCQARNGIYIYNSSYIDIGSLNGVAYSNTFHNLNCGIRLYGDMNIATKLDTNRSSIGLYNNNFYMLNDCSISGSFPEHQKLGHCYSHPYGVGVFAEYGGAPSLFDAKVEVRNTDAASNTVAFTDCDKAIVCKNVSLTAENIYVENALMGIMCQQTTGRRYQVNNNILENSFLGMQFIGDNDSSKVMNNIINCGDVSVTYGENNYSWPIGIDVRNETNINTVGFTLKQNTITIPQYAGIGIHLLNTGSGMHAAINNISFSSTDSATLVSNTSSLMNGIYATNCIGSGLQQNHVNATNDLMIASREDEAGIFANNSTGLAITCNLIQTMRFGMMAQSNCYTDSDKVKGNTMFNHILGWALRHLGNEGTFGNVGAAHNDNNNIFGGSNYVKKVFKFCETNLGDKIYTNSTSLDLSESGSYNLISGLSNDCKYGIETNFGTITTYNCPVILPSYYSTNSMDLDEALLIATDRIEYAEYQELSHWMDARKLYRILDEDEDFRNSNSVLSTFYDDMQTEMVSMVNSAEDRVLAMLSSMSSLDTALYHLRIEEALTTNSNIVEDRVQDANEEAINSIYIKLIEYGIDSLSSEDSATIVDLAKQCPYIGGTAVYKARSLYAMYAPASMFDDIKLCNEIGVYKAGNNSDTTKGLFNSENNYLKSLKPNLETTLLSQNQLLIYPNPTNSEIHIRYRETRDTKLQIVNMLGIVIKEVILSKEVQHVLANMVDLTPGIYIYRQIQNETILNTGKLIIVN